MHKRTDAPAVAKRKPLPKGVADFDTLPDDALVSMHDIARLTGSGVSTTWRRAAMDASFPKLLKFSARCTRARAGDVRRWLASKGQRDA